MSLARLDLHSHTNHSGDCFVSLEELVRLAAGRGITHLAVTDHDNCKAAQQHAGARWPIDVIFGEEVSLDDGGHLIALGIREEIRSRTLPEALREMRAAGAFTIVPHPYKSDSGILGRPGSDTLEARALLREWADAIEVCNSKLPDAENARAFVLARELGKPMVAGSDAHFGYDVGDAVLEVDCGGDLLDWREWIRSGRSARVLMNKFVRHKGFDEHRLDTRVNTTLPSVRRWVPPPVRRWLKRNLHRAVYGPRMRRQAYSLEELRF